MNIVSSNTRTLT